MDFYAIPFSHRECEKSVRGNDSKKSPPPFVYNLQSLSWAFSVVLFPLEILPKFIIDSGGYLCIHNNDALCHVPIYNISYTLFLLYYIVLEVCVCACVHCWKYACALHTIIAIVFVYLVARFTHTQWRIRQLNWKTMKFLFRISQISFLSTQLLLATSSHSIEMLRSWLLRMNNKRHNGKVYDDLNEASARRNPSSLFTFCPQKVLIFHAGRKKNNKNHNEDDDDDDKNSHQCCCFCLVKE